MFPRNTRLWVFISVTLPWFATSYLDCWSLFAIATSSFDFFHGLQSLFWMAAMVCNLSFGLLAIVCNLFFGLLVMVCNLTFGLLAMVCNLIFGLLAMVCNLICGLLTMVCNLTFGLLAMVCNCNLFFGFPPWFAISFWIVAMVWNLFFGLLAMAATTSLDNWQWFATLFSRMLLKRISSHFGAIGGAAPTLDSISPFCVFVVW
jgi:hypothetical protein